MKIDKYMENVNFIVNYIDGWNETRNKRLNYSRDVKETISEESNEQKDGAK